MSQRSHTPSYTQRQRELVRRLQALLASRAETQESLERRYSEGFEEARATWVHAVEDLNAWKTHIVETAASERQTALGAVRPGLEEEAAAARRAMDAEMAAFSARSNSMVNVASERLKESTWLAETLVESAESKARAQFEAVARSIQKKQDELRSIRETATKSLEQRRFALLPEVAASPAETSGTLAESETGQPAGAGDVPVLLGLLQERSEAAEGALQRLQHRIAPTVLSVFGVFGGSIAVAGATVLVAIWQLPEMRPAMLGQIGGGAFAAALVLMVALRLAARRRVPHASAELARELAAAEDAATRCIAAARVDRERETKGAHLRREQELKEAQQQALQVRREVDRRRDVAAPQLREQHQQVIREIQGRYEAAVAEIERVHHARTAEAEAHHEREVKKATQDRDQRIEELESDRASAVSRLQEHWRTEMAAIRQETEVLQDRAATLWPGWPEVASRGVLEELPPAAMFGTMAVNLRTLSGGVPEDPSLLLEIPQELEVPATLDLLGRGSLLIEHPPEARADAIAALRAAMLRLLTTFPPGKVRFTIFDPVGLGESFAGFMHLADFEPALVSDRIWTDARHIEQKLADLTEHMETVIQKYLRNEYDCIQDYNAEAGEIAEPFRFLVIADFPANFSESATKRLASILSSGPRCGVFTLIAADTGGGVEAGGRGRGVSFRLPHWIPMEEIGRSSNRLTWRGPAAEGTQLQSAAVGALSDFEWQDDDFGRFPLKLESPPGDDVLTGILQEVGRQAKDTSRVQVPFQAVAPAPDAVWTRSSAQGINVPLGRSGARKVQELSLGRGTAQHALIAGRTGSGKSNLLHVLVSNAALWYSPSEIEMYLVDFKKGVEFKTYAAHALPHARVIAIESEREFGLSVLRRLDAELTRRGGLFRDAGGGGVQDVAAYRRETGRPMPRILLIVDEFQEFFVEDDKIAQEATLLLDRLVRQGRAFGMHVVLGSQTLGGAYSIARSTIGQMAVRIALQCSEADCYLIMSEENNAPRLLARPGEAIYNDASGLVEGNSPFQVVFLPDEVRDRWLPRVRSMLAERGMVELPPPIVFEGNMPAHLEESREVLESIANQGGRPQIWLGEPVSIKERTSITLQRQSGSNLLIVGQQEEAALAIMTSAALTLGSAPAALAAGNGQLRGPRVVVFDGGTADTPLGPVLQEVVEQLGGEGAGVVRPRQASAAIAELAQELDRRDREEDTNAPSVFLLIHGLHRFRDLRKSDEFSFGGDDRADSAPAQFTRLLRDGPPLGIHTVAWCDTVANLDRTLERSALREFEARILFQMSASDSTHLMDTPQAAMLGRYRAILYHEDAGTIERFRPWALPDAAIRRRLAAGVRVISEGPPT
jgi:DNA segregation ATPase FtsK/SpoIIIE, S-DNA-T family